MTPFYTRFGELAARETRCIHQVLPGGPLPVGQYGFVEFYCEEDNCDCRRVLIQVTTPQAPQTALASINYGWESAEFYARWMHGDNQAGRDIAGAILDPLQPQSIYADHLLDVFQAIVRTDPAYVPRLARHYELFKRAPGYQPLQPASGALPTPLKPYLAAPKVGRNDPCPCGSGRKYKQCCGKR